MSAYLLDTHALLWFIDDNPKLSRTAKEILESEGVELSVSIASLWEISIKANLGKLSLEGNLSRLEEDLQQLDIALKPILIAELDAYLGLPLHHRDPFDRLLIAQAIAAGLPIISADEQFDAYEVARIW